MADPTLSDETRLGEFVQGCEEIYRNWQSYTPAIRRSKISEKVRQASRSVSMPQFSFVFKPLKRDGGHFLAGTWRLEIDTGVSERHAVGVDEMLWFCSILYHESRHGEQWYRCVQGALAGDLRPSTNQVRHKSLGSTVPEVQAKLRPVGQRALTDPKKLKPADIASRLGVPLAVVQHAEARGAHAYAQYARELPISNWFHSVWGSNRRHRGEVLKHPQIQAAGTVANQNYHNLPEEADAFATQHALEQRLRLRLQSVAQRAVTKSKGVKDLRKLWQTNP